MVATLAVLWGVARLVRGDPLASNPAIGIPVRFDLVDGQGQPVTATSYRGRWLLLYFGYTYCPDVCPTALQSISTALDDLGPEADRISALFITIDPARDTPAAVEQYVRLFDDRIVGATGGVSQITELETLLHIRVVRDAVNRNGDYSIQHSSVIYLINPPGRLDTVFPTGTGAEALQTSIAARMLQAERGG